MKTAMRLLFAVSLTLATQARAQLMTDYVPPSLLNSNEPTAVSLKSALIRVDTNPELAALARKRLDTGQRWEKFETEFGIQSKNPSLLMGTIESAKYQLDKSTFAIQEFADNLSNALQFDYGWSDLTGSKPTSIRLPRHLNSNPLADSLENVRFKSDIDLRLAGRTFVGLKLEMPIGD